ncbi:GGDEF and EAL domain-containing protein [Pseudomonas sp. WAC2]|uniref:putative bifunctional diguanylate cyclase/phosphodiesterase n=1 Tax=Pseudomonas sp. WAC2 TaxID=3055057 RepID=UPI0025B0AB56|nr:GGDEF and EAL domain-containing protein [Pseudomonas sp. WAC2]MDN3234162.1 EAL domain-containing protein [Pseudomonas sp. WAC2]
MKIHPDAASLSVAEVATQPPVPAQLGMLRFERLNEPSWALLDLDQACEKSLGLPAYELCSLLESPYASLMEPAARYHLHDAIQQQLLKRRHYVIRYTLHAPAGATSMVEIGEAISRHGREILHGYLIPVELASEAERLTTTLMAQNRDLKASLDLFEQSCVQEQARVDRVRAHRNLLLELTQHAYSSSDPLQEAAQLITRAASETCSVKRASVWQVGENHLRSVYTHGESPNTSSVSSWSLDDFPAYVEALHKARSIDAQDAQHDPRTREWTKPYLLAHDIRSLLDICIRVDGRVLGILRLEQTGQPRIWQNDEIAFACELADQYAKVLDSQERRSATHALHLFQRAVEQSANAFLLVNRKGEIEYINPSFTTITQYTAEEVCGQPISELPALTNWSELLPDAYAALEKQNSWQGELRCQRKDQISYWGHLSLSKVYSDNGELTHYIGIFEDITQAKLTQQNMEKLAYRDSLTGLANRHYFIDRLEKRLAGREDIHNCLMLIDIDHFKRINDSLGHEAGDNLLVSLARRLQSSLGQSTLIARIASNEFAVLLEQMDTQEGLDVASALLSMLEKPIYVESQPTLVSCSIGLTVTPDHGKDSQTLMKHAGLALHKAKASGGNRVQVYTQSLVTEASHKLFMQNNLRRALELNELEVHYQPKICLKSAQLLGLEALLRWNHPERGMIRPDQFISVAEETGLIIPIGKWVIREACRQIKALDAAGLGHLQMAINLSPKQFTDQELVSSIRSILIEERLPPHRLELELTESLLLDATDETRQQLEEMKQIGLSLAMDDFGTGYSSLSYLKKFPIDVIKIDRSFIKDIPANQDDMEITSAVVAMAHNLRLKVVAEGIETTQQLSFLRRHHCDVGQGYLFDRPIPGNELLDSLRRYLNLNKI